jgi:HSP20 family molecular chaperone IbpA
MLGTNKKEGALAKKEEPEATLAAVDVFENEKEFLLVADLPGVPQGGADVTLERNHLLVQATAQARKYRRELIVPSTIDAEGVEAQIKNGVLTVRLPKRSEQKPRQIAVRGA